MPDFPPPDTIFDILLRLPVKDLLRYRCVSTAWRSLIDDPGFIKLHLHRSKETNSNMAAALVTSNAVFSIDLDAPAPSAAVKINHPMDLRRRVVLILGSCNGLLALLYSHNDVVLWNPSTRKYRKLPVTDEINVPSGFSLSYLDLYGFGYDTINNDYKLVRITQFRGIRDKHSFRSEAEVYSAKENAWKRKNCGFRDFYHRSNRYTAFVGNALHWMVSRKRQSDVVDSIVAFDLVKEEYHEIPEPKYRRANNNALAELKDLGGSLCVFYNYYSEDCEMCLGTDIWVMKEYGDEESWTKLSSVELPIAIGKLGYVTPVAYQKSGDQVLLNQDIENFIAYDLITKRATTVRIPGLPQWFETCLFVGSLVGLDGDWDEVSENTKKKNHKKQDLKAEQRLDLLSKLGFQLVGPKADAKE